MSQTVNTRNLTRAVKAQLWRGINLLDPKLADGIKNDPIAARIRERTGATVVFSVEDFERYMKAGGA